jgi:3'-phosphoadenosine 5'-phosphosulfate (PAPS) 3'-phosphatase
VTVSPTSLCCRFRVIASAEPGSVVLAVNRNAMRVEGKLDGSPVTEADLTSDRIIGEGLAQLLPDVPALSEERVQLARPPYRGSFILVDPLDGTKEFVAGRDEFTVNLAPRAGRRRCRSAAARPGRPENSRTDSHPPRTETRRALDCRRQPLPWRSQERSLY